MSDKAEWRHSGDAFINEVCAAWHLPLLPQPSPRKTISLRKDPCEKLPPHWPEHELVHEDDHKWQADRQRFAFIIDSQVVQRVTCGHASITNDTYRHVFQRIMNRIVKLIDSSLLPSRDTADPVQWRPREFNARADYLCNQALDSKSSYCFIDDCIDDYRIDGVHWEAFSDGACRGDGFSPFSWIIYAVWRIGQQRQRFTVAFGYEIVVGNYSSFVTELWGLDRAALTLESIIH